MTGSQKEWQLRVYQAFKTAGFSEMQSRIMTAEIGRENGYQAKYLFGGHPDPHRGTNLGMMSLQGSRTPKLVAFLREAGVITGTTKIAQNQAALDAQARFIMWEMKNTHKNVGGRFLSQPNISYAAGVRMIGKEYIAWRIDDPVYATKGAKSRDGFYNMLVKQLGTGTTVTPTSSARPGVSAAELAKNTMAPVPTGSKTKSKGDGSGVYKNANTTPASSPAAVVAKEAVDRTKPAVTPAGTNTVLKPDSGKDTSKGGASPGANTRPAKAAAYARSRAAGKSRGECAKYVRLALQSGGGYKFVGWPVAAGDYANGMMTQMGMVQIDHNAPRQVGDVMVINKNNRHPYGHIQIYDGRAWISDFVQNTWKVYTPMPPWSLWRDKEYLNGAATTSGRVGSDGTPAGSDGSTSAGAYGVSAPTVPYTPAKMAYNDNKEKDAARKAATAAQKERKKHDSGYKIEKGKASLVITDDVKVDSKPVPTKPAKPIEEAKQAVADKAPSKVPLDGSARVPASVPINSRTVPAANDPAKPLPIVLKPDPNVVYSSESIDRNGNPLYPAKTKGSHTPIQTKPTPVGGSNKQPPVPKGTTAKEKVSKTSPIVSVPSSDVGLSGTGNAQPTSVKPASGKTNVSETDIEKELRIQKETNKNLTQKMAEAEARKSNDDLASSVQTLKESLWVQKQMLERLSSMDKHIQSIARGQVNRNITESSDGTAKPEPKAPTTAQAKNQTQYQVKRPARNEPMSMSKLA